MPKGVDKLNPICYNKDTIKKGIDTMTKHYLFEDYELGEEFIVGAKTFEEAVEEAKYQFPDPHYICELTEEEAEASGLDEY